jgi:glutamine synthetase
MKSKRFTDLKGTWHHVTYNFKAINADLLANGMPFDGKIYF